jgi:hypothetical protein
MLIGSWLTTKTPITAANPEKIGAAIARAQVKP